MLKKLQLFHSATAIGMVIGALATPLTKVQANPSLPTTDRPSISTPQPVTNIPTNSSPSTVQRNPATNNPVPSNPTTTNKPTANSPAPKNSVPVAFSPKIDTISGVAETALAEHLAKSEATFYGAYWCSHCQKQKSLFGATAAAKLPYVECAANAENSQRQLCKDKNIQLFPTWVVKGKLYPGIKDLKEIAAMTDYKGPKNFQYHK
jgi:thiol-disulfide isomerase/thioredoxin